jgi:citrate lyase subunit beta/citryl-CoA lyase
MASTRVRRSLLIAPAHKENLLAKLAKSAADVCILELEDGVHASMKDVARNSAARLLVELDWGVRERIVRINRVTSAEGEADIAALAAAKPDGVLLPKVESEQEIRRAAELLSAAERAAGVSEGTIRIWSMIETAKGLTRAEEICAADARMTGLIFGVGDFGADIAVKRLSIGSFRRFPAPSHEYLYARGRVVAAARAAEIDPIDVGHSTFGDSAGTQRTAEISAQMGFTGSVVFHPRQVSIINEAFSPDEEDVAWASRVVDEIKAEAAKDEAGSIAIVDGDMIDGPFLINAQDILARHERFRVFDEQKQAGARL